MESESNSRYSAARARLNSTECCPEKLERFLAGLTEEQRRERMRESLRRFEEKHVDIFIPDGTLYELTTSDRCLGPYEMGNAFDRISKEIVSYVRDVDNGRIQLEEGVLPKFVKICYERGEYSLDNGLITTAWILKSGGYIELEFNARECTLLLKHGIIKVSTSDESGPLEMDDAYKRLEEEIVSYVRDVDNGRIQLEEGVLPKFVKICDKQGIHSLDSKLATTAWILKSGKYIELKFNAREFALLVKHGIIKE